MDGRTAPAAILRTKYIQTRSPSSLLYGNGHGEKAFS